jgi:hypothetical protein
MKGEGERFLLQDLSRGSSRKEKEDERNARAAWGFSKRETREPFRKNRDHNREVTGTNFEIS